MKARTLNQKRVVEVDRKIPYINKAVSTWAKNKLFEFPAHRYKSGTTNCLRCGHRWKAKSKEAWHDQIIDSKCPSCKSKIKIVPTNKRKDSDRAVFSYVMKMKEFQVIRTYIIRAFYKCQEPVHYSIIEQYRVYIGENGKREVIGGIAMGWSGYFSGSMELRQPTKIHSAYSREGFLYPKWNLQDYVIKSGFNAYDYNEGKRTVVAWLYPLLAFKHYETVKKHGNKNLTQYCFDEPEKAQKYWSTIKICIRHKYKIEQPRSYFDMIEALAAFKKDLRNPHFICPKEFRKAHDFWIDKAYKRRMKIQAKKELTLKLNEISREKIHIANYNARVEKFSELNLISGKIVIKPLMSVDVVKQAGELMHHCIYKTVSYWQDADNLLLGAYKNKKLIETAQYSLEKSKLLHCYGVLNKTTPEHDEIVALINSSKKQIADCLNKKRKKKVAISAKILV